MYSKSLAGNHLKMFINGALYGYVTSSTWDISPAWREVRTLDNMLPVELAPTGIQVSGTFDVLRGRMSGGLEGFGAAALGPVYSAHKYVSLQLYDRVSGILVFETDQAQIVKQVWRVTPKQVVMGTVSWLAIGFFNESLGTYMSADSELEVAYIEP